MDKIIDKISSYNIFNYVFPGVLYCIICDKYLNFPLIQESLVTGLFLYYFVGLIISRIGSLVLEPILISMKIVKFSDYSDYVRAEKEDEKIALLSEINNMYRTIVSLILFIAGTAAYIVALERWPEFRGVSIYLILTVLFILFLLSYRKQTAFITKRVSSNK
jgi:hypothetical protein